jgi:O-antigen/teichoic acid export membrane protein
MLLITIPVAVYSMIVGEDIVTLLFRHKEFGQIPYASPPRYSFGTCPASPSSP